MPVVLAVFKNNYSCIVLVPQNLSCKSTNFLCTLVKMHDLFFFYSSVIMSLYDWCLAFILSFSVVMTTTIIVFPKVQKRNIFLFISHVILRISQLAQCELSKENSVYYNTVIPKARYVIRLVFECVNDLFTIVTPHGSCCKVVKNLKDAMFRLTWQHCFC
jgi:hypothetical protein